MGLPGGVGTSVQMCMCISVCVCVGGVGLVPVSCWAVASLCFVSCVTALWAVAGPEGEDVNVEGGMHALI